MTEIRTFDQIQPGDGDAVGGKGLSLGFLAQAGLPVPPGFCITSAAHRRLRGQPPGDAMLTGAIAAAYHQLGGGPVAVRSSATDEDGTVLSFAGQQETILGVSGEADLLGAVARCWDSLDSERSTAYRRQQAGAASGRSGNGLAMAVVVQRLVAAEVAGVLFTRDPLDPEGKRMLVEASWGLGETVVSGQVTPDRFHLDWQTGTVCERHVSTKTVALIADCRLPIADRTDKSAIGNLQSAIRREAVPPHRQGQPCLDDPQLEQLAELGRQVERLYGGPRDIEWAWADGRFWLLQARPITTADAAEREQVRCQEIATLRALAEPGGTVWSRYNLAEGLPEPTPMTWAIVRRFLSGRGGYGLMYRDLGFKPHASLDEAGVYDLVCGRPYCNLSREPRLYSGWLPFEHPFALLKADPSRALYPRAVQNPARAGALFWLLLPLRLPFIVVKSVAFAVRLGRLSRSFADHFRRAVLPAFAAEVERAGREDCTALTTPALLERLEFWIHRTLYAFARDSLKPTALAAIALGNVERWLKRALGPGQTTAALGELAMDVRPDPEADFAGAVRDLAGGRLERSLFLERFGHRGPQEMELARPRWGEDHTALDRLLAGARSQESGARSQESGVRSQESGVRSQESGVRSQESGVRSQESGVRSQESGVREEAAAPSSQTPDSCLLTPAQRWERIAAEAKLSSLQKMALEPEVRALQTYLGLRETAKHYLMRGYALVRQFLLELDRRFKLEGGIFFLTPDELPRLTAGEDLSGLIVQRRRRQSVALSLEMPQVLFSDDLDAVGQPLPPPVGADTLHGVPLSAGVAEAPALVLEQPVTENLPAEPYILVCPSTDPAWVPLFVGARGLVMETGGVLSHGAIVAREFGLPAVAGLPGVQKRLRTGQRLRVDGASGVVTVLPLERMEEERERSIPV